MRAAFALLGTGLCGLTTFSTFGYETLRLLEDGALGEAGLNVIGSLVAAVLVAWLGYRLAPAVLGRWPSWPLDRFPPSRFNCVFCLADCIIPPRS